MRIQGNDATSIRPEAEVILKRADGDITLTVQALTPDFADKQEADLPSPQPKRLGFAKDKRGIQLHPETGKPIVLYAEDDLAHIAKRSKVAQLQTVKMLVDALKPGQLIFDTKKGADIEEYYEGIRSEMVSFGFTVGDFRALLDAITQVSGMDDEELDEATADFFDEAS